MLTLAQRIVMLAVAADLLTFSRLIAAGIMLWLGLQGPQTLPWAILVAVLAWTTDQLDGWAARRASTPTHLAPADFAIDSALYACTLAYLVMTGFVPAAPAIAFVVLALGLWLIYRRKAIAILCVRLIDLLSALVIFKHKPLIGALLVGWVVVLAVLYRRRLMERVPLWLAELAHLVGWNGAHSGKTR
jgi:phosphatidylglycerophosphate synthase